MAFTAITPKIAMVPQTAVLFTGTIRENLQWGKKMPPMKSVGKHSKSLKAATSLKPCRSNWIPRFLKGQELFWRTKQRLTIARALIAKPDILILDDSLSALDYQTDLDLRMALKESIRGTVIIISQRVRSIQDAQQILVLDQGNLVGKGPMKSYWQRQKNTKKSWHHRQRRKKHEKNHSIGRPFVATSLFDCLREGNLGGSCPRIAAGVSSVYMTYQIGRRRSADRCRSSAVQRPLSHFAFVCRSGFSDCGQSMVDPATRQPRGVFIRRRFA